MLASQVLYSVEMGLLLLAGCVLIGPVLAERVRVPGLIGLIAVGMLPDRTCSNGCDKTGSSPQSVWRACCI